MFHHAFETLTFRASSTFAAGVAALTVAWAFTNLAAAQAPGGTEQPVDRTFNVPVPGPEGQPPADVLIPAPLQGEVPITEPYRQRLLDRNAQALISGPAGPHPGNEAAEQILQQRLQMLQAQQEQLARAYQEALQALEKTSPRSAQLEVEKHQLQTQLQLMKGQVAELAA